MKSSKPWISSREPGRRLVSSDPVLVLKSGREKSLLRRHPWIFSGAVQSLKGDPAGGESIRILSADGAFLGWGAYSPHSQIRARVWSWDEKTPPSEDLINTRVEEAIAARQRWFSPEECNSFRLLHGESDGLPGVIADRYGDWLVVQFLSFGSEYWRKATIDSLARVIQPRGIFERSDADVRELEGLEMRTGTVWGNSPPEQVQIDAHGLKFWADLYHGHKTGFYLDQRENYPVVKSLARGAQVLDCFCYAGGFSIAALAGAAAAVTAVDSSEDALALTRKNLQLNQIDEDSYHEIHGDVFQVLRKMRDQRSSFDLVVLDPPKFAPTASQIERAARGYKDINLLAFKLLRPGGTLVTFSCSGGVDMALFQKIVASAALDAQVEAQIIQRLHQARDHPVGLAFPEGEYLKGLVIKAR